MQIFILKWNLITCGWLDCIWEGLVFSWKKSRLHDSSVWLPCARLHWCSPRIYPFLLLKGLLGIPTTTEQILQIYSCNYLYLFWLYLKTITNSAHCMHHCKSNFKLHTVCATKLTLVYKGRTVIWLDPSAYYAPNTETLLNLRFDSGMERSSRWDGETTFWHFQLISFLAGIIWRVDESARQAHWDSLFHLEVN